MNRNMQKQSLKRRIKTTLPVILSVLSNDTFSNYSPSPLSQLSKARSEAIILLNGTTLSSVKIKSQKTWSDRSFRIYEPKQLQNKHYP